jgi:hypothetical protein
MDFKPCEKCKVDLGIDVLVDTILKKDKSGTYMKNLDGSYHVQPFEQPNGEKTKWFHVSSKEHAEWTRTHNGPSGFLQPKQTTVPSGPVANTQPVLDTAKVELKPEEKGLFDMYKQKMRGILILESAVREVLSENGEKNPDPSKVGLMMKLVGELA